MRKIILAVAALLLVSAANAADTIKIGLIMA